MISSNVIVNKNAASKVANVFNGNIDSNKVFSIDVKFSGLLEITVFVNTIKAGSTLFLTRSGAFSTDLNRPKLLDKFGQEIANNRYFFTEEGLHSFYVDTLSFNRLSITLTQGTGTDFANVDLSYSLYSEKFTALDFLKPAERNLSDVQISQIDGLEKKGVISLNKGAIQGNIYALFSSDIYSVDGSLSSHFFIRITDSNSTSVYPEVIDADTGKVASYGNAQVRLDRPKNLYVDLVKYNSELLIVGITASDPSLKASVIFKGFSSEKPPLKSTVDEVQKVMLEGKGFRFVKKGDFTDAWNGLFVKSYARGTYISDDLNEPRKTLLDAGSVIDLEGANVVRALLVPYDPLMRNTSKNTRVNLVLTNKNVYHNYANGGGINDWAKSKFWECRNTNRKIPVMTELESDEFHRFDPTLTAERYGRNGTVTEAGWKFIEYQEQPNFTYLGALCRTKKMVLWGSYLTTGERIGVWMTTDGGANYVLIYDFIDGLAILPNPVNTSSFEAYTGGLSLKKVVITYPSQADKEPANPFSYTDIPMNGIVKGIETDITAPAHGLVNGDIILLTGAAQDEKWKALTCDSFTSSGIKQNVYSVTKLTDDTIRLKTYIGSYDRPLIARHVHSINESLGGCIISTGEEHPNSWFLYATQRFKDASSVVNAFDFRKTSTYRLNSSEEGIQRACGLLMDNAPDPNIIFNCDTSNKSLGVIQVDGRTSDLPPRPSNGIWKGKVSDIDDWTKFECVADIPEPAIWLYQLGKVILGYYQLGGMVVSIDAGETWEYFLDGTSFFSGVFNGKMAIGMGYVFEWK